MKKVQIEPGCITCGLCEYLAPEVFEVTDVSRVRPGKERAVCAQVEQAAKLCPVAVIAIKESKKESDEKL